MPMVRQWRPGLAAQRRRPLPRPWVAAPLDSRRRALPPVDAVRPSLPLARPAGRVSVSFKLPYHCKFGQKLCLVGGDDKLGGWTVERAVEMSWTEGDVWTVELQLPSE